MTPIFFDPHVCCPPATTDLIGREMDFECRCGRRWRLEHYLGKDGSLLGPSWIMLWAAHTVSSLIAVSLMAMNHGPGPRFARISSTSSQRRTKRTT